MQEAQDALPEVAGIAQRMVGARAELLALQPASRLDNPTRTNGSGPGHQQPEVDAERVAEVRRLLMAELEALEQLGVLVKEVDTALLDFPCVHPATGETVLLCWKLGEPEIGFWHPLDAGYAGRKPLPIS